MKEEKFLDAIRRKMAERPKTCETWSAWAGP